MYNRIIASQIVKSKKSILLLGPRQVGKSTLIRSLKPDLEINLANEAIYFDLVTNIENFQRQIEASSARTIFVDEIQRIPRLTNTIQYLVDKNKKLKFYLTGSSARKLKRGKANLLPGRILEFFLGPLSALELQDDWNESEVLKYGSLPELTNMKSEGEKKRFLKSYSNLYLKEEIMAESLVRQIEGFVRFLSSAAVDSGKYLDFSKLSKKSKVPRQSVVRNFEILEDTLIARRVENDPEIDTEKIDLVKHPRFYFFDLGITNALKGSFDIGPDRIGLLYETLVYNQIVNTAYSKNLDFDIYNFRTRGGYEVDFILRIEDQRMAIECKSTPSIGTHDLSSIKRINEFYPKAKKFVLYRGTKELKEGNIWILPLKTFLKQL